MAELDVVTYPYIAAYTFYTRIRSQTLEEKLIASQVLYDMNVNSLQALASTSLVLDLLLIYL